MTSASDNELIVFLAGAGGCSLDSSPKTNWVERSGGLPNYICKIAKAVMGTGKSKSAAIAIAISRCKKWAAGGDDVDADTRAKAAKAIAEWEALKGKNKAKKVVKATRQDGSDYLVLSNTGSYNTDVVRQAWNKMTSDIRMAQRENARANGVNPYDSPEIAPYSYIRELWNDHIIVEVDATESSSQSTLMKVDYSVSGSQVTFSDAVEVKQEYVEVDDTLSSEEEALLGDVLVLTPDTPTARILAMHRKLKNGVVL